MEEICKLKIYNLEDRLEVAKILVKNGYAVQQVKEKRNESGKAVNYLLKITEGGEDAAESR